MLNTLRPALVLLTLLSLLTGIAYPALVTALAQTVFPWQANGSLIREHDRVIGSALIGQTFSRPAYFQGRPSAAGNGYDPTASGGSNFAPNAQALADRIKTDLARWSPLHAGAVVPADLLTASASGLDPDISPEAAEFQVERVASARHLDTDRVRDLVREHTRPRALGFAGEPAVNVLALNRALDGLQ